MKAAPYMVLKKIITLFLFLDNFWVNEKLKKIFESEAIIVYLNKEIKFLNGLFNERI